MQEYHLVWSIQLDADNARDAAEKARSMMLNPQSTATVFEVTCDGVTETVDLDDEV